MSSPAEPIASLCPQPSRFLYVVSGNTAVAAIVASAGRQLTFAVRSGPNGHRDPRLPGEHPERRHQRHPHRPITTITINSPINVTPTGTAGNLTLQAGRSLVLNASINTGGGSLASSPTNASQRRRRWRAATVQRRHYHDQQRHPGHRPAASPWT